MYLSSGRLVLYFNSNLNVVFRDKQSRLERDRGRETIKQDPEPEGERECGPTVRM
jgi:hypothetical protein